MADHWSETGPPLTQLGGPSCDPTLFLRLASPEDRREAARALARMLGADDLLLFLRDSEVGVLLPAPGLQQTLPDGHRWRMLLDASVDQGEAEDTIRAPELSEPQCVWALACGRDTVVALIGGAPVRPQVRALCPLFLLTALAVQGEQATGIARANAGIAQEAAARAESLAGLLDRALRRAEAAHKIADGANRAKAAFLATMSHELRTPLNAIGGYAELMMMEIVGPLTATQRDHLGRIQASQRHLLGLIESILSYARIEAGQLNYTIVNTALGPALEDVVTLVAPQARAKRLRLVTGPFADDLRVRADIARLRQIMLNLLANAVKFTPSGGAVTVQGEASGPDRVTVSVVDTGVGIASDQHDEIFAPFMQVGRSLTSSDEGVGLGLAISRDLARAMGGDLTVESELGKGATFRLVLSRG